MSVDVLGRRALNRATLERQLLLRRSTMSPSDAIHHLVGLQAQNPLDPYLALWSRLDGFDPALVGAQLVDRSLVRFVVMRGTIHLVTADDAAALRPSMQPVLDAEIARHSEFAPHLIGRDISPVLAVARRLMTEQPMTTAQLRSALAEHCPDVHAAAAAYACRCLLPLVQVPPRGVWGRAGQVTLAVLDGWLGRQSIVSIEARSIDAVVLRYLAAFGPAAVADVATWSRLTGLREVIDRLRPQLRVFRDDRGRELYDLPDAPRPNADVIAPVRFVPEYDNVLLSHADRSRFGSDDEGALSRAVGPYKGAVLVDGEVRAIWHSEHDKTAKRSTVVVEHVPMGESMTTEVEAEAHRVADFWHASATDRAVSMRPIGTG